MRQLRQHVVVGFLDKRIMVYSYTAVTGSEQNSLIPAKRHPPRIPRSEGLAITACVIIGAQRQAISFQ
jgi:hypothetical protein